MHQNQIPPPEKPLIWWFCGLLFGGMVLLGMVWPDPWWGTHFWSFFPVPAVATGLLLGAGLWAMGVWKPFSLPALPFPKKVRQWWLLAFSMLVGMLCYQFPMYADAYGDSAWFGKSFVDEKGMGFMDHLSLVLSPNIFHPKSGERTVLNLVAILEEGFGIGFWEAFRLLGGLCGAAWVWIWGKFADRLTNDAGKRWLLWLMGMGSPVWLLFMGHLEVYVPGLVAFLGFFVLLVGFFKTKDRKTLIWTTVVWLLCLKMHSVAWLLLPSLGLGWLKQLAGDSSDRWNKLLTWKGIGLWVVLPVFVLGAVLYFVVLGDHADPRFLGEGINVYDRLFLPIFAPEPPLDRYTLLGLNHLGDYLQEMLLWSPGAWLVVMVAVGNRRKIQWQHPEILVTGLSLLLLTAFFFMVNPLLGMTVDWDLLAMPAPALWVFAALLVAQPGLFWRRATGPLLAFWLWAMVPFLYLHQSPSLLGHRLESLGRHSFKTYWIRSSGTLLAGIDLRRNESMAYEEELERTLSDLQPYAIPGDDHEYGFLLWEIGRYYREDVRNPAKAVVYHRRSATYAPQLEENALGLMESNFMLGNFAEAYQASKKLVELEFPSAQQAQRIAIHCALEAGAYAEAQQRVKAFNASWPADQLIERIQQAFENGQDPSQLKFLFQRK